MGMRMPIDLYRVVIPAYPLSIPISKKIVLLVFLVVNKKSTRMPIGSICVVNPAYQLSVLISKKIVFLVFLVV